MPSVTQQTVTQQTVTQPVPPSLSAIVLAGGLSTRMGQDKALISIQGTPLLQRVCQVAQHCTPQIYVVTPWIKRYAALRDAMPFVEWIAETRSPTMPPHPMMGFLQGLEQVQTDWVLLLACDLPNLNSEILRSWSSQLAQMPEAVTACLPKNPAGWWEPLCGFYRSRCRSQIAALISQEQLSFQRWFNQELQESVQELALSDARMLLNCNTPEDLQGMTG